MTVCAIKGRTSFVLIILLIVISILVRFLSQVVMLITIRVILSWLR